MIVDGYHMMTEEQWQARMSFICEGLWVSEVACRANKEGLKRIGVDTVVSILTKAQQDEWDVRAPVYHAQTNPHSNPYHYTYDFADGDYIKPSQMKNILSRFGDVTLLHCISGANRSSAVAICYLMAHRNMDPVTACHTYWTQRGRSTANVYGSVPRMADRMLKSVIHFYTALQCGFGEEPVEVKTTAIAKTVFNS
jgi:hypothetical protein